MSAPLDVNKTLDDLAVKFQACSEGIPSILVALTHLGRATAIYRALLRAGLATPDQVVDVFAQTMDWALSAPDADVPPPEVTWIDRNGVKTKTDGRKH